MTKDDLEMILKFIGGLGMFLYGMNVMADGLQKSAGNKLKKLMEKLTLELQWGRYKFSHPGLHQP